MNRINELLTEQDNSEKIRDRIAAILKLELTKQKQLADELKIADKKDFNINVYLENSRPWELTGDNEENNPFPLVNVCLQEINKDERSGSDQNNVKYTGIYYIDCYGCGNKQPEGAEEYIPDDSLSAKRAWKTARVTRNILMSGFYTHLGLQGLVRKRSISKITTIIPNSPEGALSVTACRIIFDVDFSEKSIEASGVTFEGIDFVSKDNGEVSLINI